MRIRDNQRKVWVTEATNMNTFSLEGVYRLSKTEVGQSPGKYNTKTGYSIRSHSDG